MLNNLTIRRRTELRRLRAVLAFGVLSFGLLGVALLCGGLWQHCLPVAAGAPLVVPAIRLLRTRLHAVAKVLRLLGA